MAVPGRGPMRRRHEKIPITTVLVVNRNKLTFRSSDMDERTVVRVDGERERESPNVGIAMGRWRAGI